LTEETYSLTVVEDNDLQLTLSGERGPAGAAGAAGAAGPNTITTSTTAPSLTGYIFGNGTTIAGATAAASAATANTLVLRTGTGAASFVGITNTGNLNLATGTTFTYGTGIAASHRTALGLGSLATQSGTIADYLTIASASATYLPRLSTLTVTGTTPAFPGPLVEQPALQNGKREWLGPAGSYLQFDGSDWYLGCTDGVDTYSATVYDPTDEPWKIMAPTWGLVIGTGAPTLTIDPPTLVPVTPFTGTIALAADQYGRLSPTDMIGLGPYVSDALNVGINADGGFLTAGTGGTLPLTRGGTGSTTASDARIALGAGTTGAELFGAATAAAANTILANNIVAKNADFTLAQTDAGTYMRLTKTGSTQTITLPTLGISAGAEFQFYRITTQALAFSGGTVNGTANLASVPTNGAFALKHIASGTYDFI
jgi:hypothetical protein